MSIRKHALAASLALAAGLSITTGIARAQQEWIGWAVVNADGTMGHSLNVITVAHRSAGVYRVRFNQDVGRCVGNATLRGDKRSLLPGYLVVSGFANNSVQVNTFATVTLLPEDRKFDLTVIC